MILTKGWRCLDCTLCEGCGKGSDEARLLLCDSCDISYHTYCLDPPLGHVPQGGWKCKWWVTYNTLLVGTHHNLIFIANSAKQCTGTENFKIMPMESFVCGSVKYNEILDVSEWEKVSNGRYEELTACLWSHDLFPDHGSAWELICRKRLLFVVVKYSNNQVFSLSRNVVNSDVDRDVSTA